MVDGCMILQITGSECLRRECGYNGDNPSRDPGDPVTGVTPLSPHIVGAAPWPRGSALPIHHPPGRCSLELETKVHPKVRNHGEGPY